MTTTTRSTTTKSGKRNTSNNQTAGNSRNNVPTATPITNQPNPVDGIAVLTTPDPPAQQPTLNQNIDNAPDPNLTHPLASTTESRLLQTLVSIETTLSNIGNRVTTLETAASAATSTQQNIDRITKRLDKYNRDFHLLSTSVEQTQLDIKSTDTALSKHLDNNRADIRYVEAAATREIDTIQNNLDKITKKFESNMKTMENII